MVQAAEVMDAGEDLPPVVTTDTSALEFVAHCVLKLRERHGVRIVYDRHGERARGFSRGAETVFGAFDPGRTWASNVFGILAERDDHVVGAMQMGMYDLGNLSLAQYLAENSLFKGGPRMRLEGDALTLASAIMGTVGFTGDAWVSRDNRGGTPFSRDWIRYATLIADMLAIATRAARGTFLFSRQAVMAKINPPVETRTLGIEWGGEVRHLVWTSEGFTRKAAAAAVLDQDRASPVTERSQVVDLALSRTGTDPLYIAG
ncbi:hypothetical protein [Thalassobaculum litoreum]|uniref:Uncharacterized protein n=1 Tax=Thalassobaculum litoreum DSM 18839 TaxID=1123362 RepID=A0A8G2BHZ3_9PROT|nr:hypothetical protein [Thalassobaculum litoreum]SDF82775.1 hypothetical protein SAMN05660686_02434 [Thalassobaculum litoreum DSM 18839]